METCEKCGKKFTPATDASEVTSARILCAECEAERKAAKLAKAATGPTTAGGSPTPRPAAPSGRPQAPPPRADVPPPAARPAAPSASPPPRPSAPAAATPPARPAAPPPARSAPAPSRTAAPAAVRPSSAGRSRPDTERDEERAGARQALKHLDLNQDAKIVKYGWMVAGVVLLITLGVVFYTKSVRDAREAAEKAVLQARTEFLDGLKKLDLLTEDGCKAAIARIEDTTKREIWSGTEISTDVTNILARARTNQENIKNKTEVLEQVTKVNGKMQNVGGLTTEDLAEVQRLIHELEPKITILETRVQDEFKGYRKVVAKAFGLKLHEEAKSFAAANGDKPKQVLVKYARAEDEVRKLLDSAYTESKEITARAQKDASLAGAANEADQNFKAFEQRYKDIITESDAIADAAFTPEAVEKLPWRDLIAPDAKWNAAALAGFEHRIDSGVLHIKGPDAGSRNQGVMSIGDKEQWRDFMIDFEVTFESGGMTMYFRMGKSIQNTESMAIESHASGSAPPLQGKSYQGEASVIGSRFHFLLKTDGMEPQDTAIKWVNSRKGALGLVIPPGAKLKFTKLRVRELR